MSGITGYINITEKIPNALLTSMSKSIRYIDSDCIDKWSDDFLAISRVHHGILNRDPQPIFNEDKSLCIVMDGEVFDYQSQKQQLVEQRHYFGLKENDPEYCLHLYEANGLEAFAKLNGSFLIALYNVDLHELLLINDRFSSRPLFYFYNNEQLVFATQLRPLLKFQDLLRQLNLQAVFEFFVFQRVLGNRTFYQDVKVLPPASILRFKDGKISLEQYWKMRYTNVIHSEAYYAEALADALQNAVARRTRGNHPLGILLSGGLDSRAVLAATDKGKISVSFSLGDFRNKEVQIARRIANVMDCRHIFFKRDTDHYLRLVDEAVDIGDGMYRFDHAHFLGFLSKIRRNSDILLHGHGLDYTFQGLYLPYKELKIAGKTISLPVLHKLALTALPKALAANGYPEKLFQDHISNQFSEAINNSIKEILEDKSVYGHNVYNAGDYFVLHSLSKHFTFLNFLCVRAYMDERTTIFDNDLFNLYLSMPPQFRIKGKVFRKALRMMSPELAAIPNANTDLRADMPIILEWMFTLSRKALRKLHVLSPSQLPHSTFTNGSWSNMAELIRYNKKLKGLIAETLHDTACMDPDLFNVKTLDSIFQKHINRKENFTELLFLLFTFGRWHKKYGPK